MKIDIDEQSFEKIYKYLEEEILDLCDVAEETYDLDGDKRDLMWYAEMSDECESLKNLKKNIVKKEKVITIEKEDLKIIFKMFLEYIMMYASIDIAVIEKKEEKKRYFIGEDKKLFLEFLKELKWCENFNEKYNLGINFNEYFLEVNEKNDAKRFANQFQYKIKQYIIPERVKERFNRNFNKSDKKNLFNKSILVSRKKAISLLMKTKNNFIEID